MARETIHVDADDGDDVGLEMERLAGYSREAWRTMRDERDALQKRVDDLESDVRDHESTIEDLRQKLKEAESRIDDVNTAE